MRAVAVSKATIASTRSLSIAAPAGAPSPMAMYSHLSSFRPSSASMVRVTTMPVSPWLRTPMRLPARSAADLIGLPGLTTITLALRGSHL